MTAGDTDQPVVVFVSYAEADVHWAEWIAWQLGALQLTIRLFAWDGVPGEHRVAWLHETASVADYTVVVLSENYLDDETANGEWQATYRRRGSNRRTLIPVVVGLCEPTGLLAELTPIDLKSLNEKSAAELLTRGMRSVVGGATRPTQAPSYPGRATQSPSYPGQDDGRKMQALFIHSFRSLRRDLANR